MVTLSAALDALDASVLEQLAGALTAPQDPEDRGAALALLDRAACLAPLLSAASTSEFVDAYRQGLRVVKELCRLVMRCVSAVAGPTEDATRFLLLDDALCELLEPVAAFAARVATLEQFADAGQLSRWVPFVSAASCFVACGRLPASSLMRSTSLADRALEACSSALRVNDRSLVLSTYLTPIAAVISQGESKEQWVEPRDIRKHVLLWVVEQAAPSTVRAADGDAFGRLLALAFPLVDDLRDETQYVGAKLLRRLIHDASDSEVRWYRDVLLEVLRVGITTRQPATLDCLLACLAETLAKVSPPGEPRFFDQFMPRLLTAASLSNDVAVRAVLLKRMRPIVERIGAPHSLQLVRYLQPLLKVLIASFDSIHVDVLSQALETLRATILGAWPRVSSHIEEILAAVLRAVAFCELFGDGESSFAASPEQRKRLLPLCEDIIALLHDVNSIQVQRLLEDVGDGCAGLKPFADGLRGRLGGVQATESTP